VIEGECKVEVRGRGGQRIALPAFLALTLVAAVALTLAITGALDAPERPDARPATTPSSVAVPAASPAPPANDTRRDPRERNEQLALEIERALVSSHAQQRGSAFYVSLPELLAREPARVVELVARQEGETRDALRDEVVRLWIRKDRDAALVWMGSFQNEWERAASATIAMRTLAAIEPAQAVAVADQFGIGRDDGSLEYIVQIWATENFDECTKWLETQPDNAQTSQLRARVEQVREQRVAALE
jgi:hypothetical protein